MRSTARARSGRRASRCTTFHPWPRSRSPRGSRQRTLRGESAAGRLTRTTSRRGPRSDRQQVPRGRCARGSQRASGTLTAPGTPRQPSLLLSGQLAVEAEPRGRRAASTRSARARVVAPRRRAARRSASSASSRSSASRRARRSRGGTSEAGDAVLDRVERARRPRSRPPVARRPSPRGRRPRSPPAATGRRRPRPARSTARARPAARSRRVCGKSERSGPSPTTTSGRPARRLRELAHALLLREPSDVERVRRLVGRADPVGDRDAARDHAHVASAERPRVVGERGRRADDDAAPGGRASARAARTRRARATSEPQSCRTIGFPVASAGSALGSQCACTTSASRDARRAARANESKKSGSARTFHGAARRLLTMPSPYAIP